MMQKWSVLVLFVAVILLFLVYSKGKSVEDAYLLVRHCVHSPRNDPPVLFQDPVIVDPNQATVQQILDYLKWTNSTSCLLAHDFGGKMLKMNGFVGLDGQKTVCLDSGIAPQPGKCLVYSFGINNEWTFDDTLADYGCQVYAFDPSMNQEDHEHSKNVHFFKMGLFGEDTTSSSGWKLRTLQSIHTSLHGRHGNSVIDYLKVDIEGSEWSVIPNLIKSGMMGKIKQIGFEVHFTGLQKVEQFRERYRTLRMIEEAGFVRFSSKGNPWLKFNVNLIPSNSARLGYEIVWYNPKFYRVDNTV